LRGITHAREVEMSNRISEDGLATTRSDPIVVDGDIEEHKNTHYTNSDIKTIGIPTHF